MHECNNNQIQRVSVKCPPVWAEKPSFGLLKLIPKFSIAYLELPTKRQRFTKLHLILTLDMQQRYKMSSFILQNRR